LMREISGETTMFSLIRRKPLKSTQPEGNPKARLTRKQKQKLVKEIQQLESDIKSVDYKIERAKFDYDRSQKSLENAPEDFKKIQFCMEKQWYTSCAEICYSHGWSDGASAFNNAERLEQGINSRRRHEDAAATGVICVERQLREDKRKFDTASKSIKILTNKKQTLEQKLAFLKQ